MMRLLLRWCAGVVGIVALAACSADDAGPPPPPDPQASTASAQTPSAEPDRRAELDTIEAYYPRLADCLTGKGFPATWDPVEGAMQVEVGGEQQMDAADEADAACQEELGPKPTRAPLADAEVEGIYDQSVEAYECLVEQGYEPEEPPTKELWLAEYPSGNAWEPHNNPQSLTRFPDDVCPVPGLDD